MESSVDTIIPVGKQLTAQVPPDLCYHDGFDLRSKSHMKLLMALLTWEMTCLGFVCLFVFYT